MTVLKAVDNLLRKISLFKRFHISTHKRRCILIYAIMRWISENYRWLVRFLQEEISVPLMLMYFLMLMVNTLLRDTKDTLLVTSPAGVEAIPVLKTWAVIPASMGYFYFYSKLSKRVSRQVLQDLMQMSCWKDLGTISDSSVLIYFVLCYLCAVPLSYETCT